MPANLLIAKLSASGAAACTLHGAVSEAMYTYPLQFTVWATLPERILIADKA